MNGRPPLNDLLCPIQSLYNLVYLTELDADNQHEVAKYMAMANVELLRLSDAAVKFVLPGGPSLNRQPQ